MERDMALLIVDVQNDFCPGGTLAVPDGDRVVEPLNRAASCFSSAGLAVLATRDWHLPVTRHFREYGGPWPVHCVQGSSGAAFHPALRLPEKTVLLHKGADPERNGYSAFEAVTEESLTLKELFSSKHVRHIFVGGLATDYCILNTVLDALHYGFEVTVLTDAVAGVDLAAGDSERAIEEMRRAGADFCTVDELVA